MEMKRFLNMVADIFYLRCCPVCQKILADQRRMICPNARKNFVRLVIPDVINVENP